MMDALSRIFQSLGNIVEVLFAGLMFYTALGAQDTETAALLVGVGLILLRSVSIEGILSRGSAK